MSGGLQALPTTILQPSSPMQKGLVESKARATEGGVFGYGRGVHYVVRYYTIDGFNQHETNSRTNNKISYTPC